jgi:hypothetical protein
MLTCIIFFLFFFYSTGAWTQDLHLEPLHQPFFVMGFFEIGSHKLFPRAGLEWWSSWSLLPESRIIGMGHWRLASNFLLLCGQYCYSSSVLKRIDWLDHCHFSEMTYSTFRDLQLFFGHESNTYGLISTYFSIIA